MLGGRKMVLENVVVTEINRILKDNKEITVLCTKIRDYDANLYRHSYNVAYMGALIGRELEIYKDGIEEIIKSGLMHDIGKIYLDKRVLNKKGKLTDEEYAYVKNHVILGYKTLKKISQLTDISKYGVLEHHENMCGSGYPNGLIGEEISIVGKIIHVADVYDAVVSDRPYHKRWGKEKALKHIESMKGIMFDEIVADALERVV